jgi:anti-anti-sigma factor
MKQGYTPEAENSKISASKIGSRNVLTPKGSLTYQNIETLKTLVDECLKENHSELILDCAGVTFMDSETLECMLEMHDRMREQGSSLKLINLTGVCLDIMIATRLIHIFHVYKDIHKILRNGS